MPMRIFITDKEVAQVLEISCATLSRILGGFTRGGTSGRATFASRDIDLTAAKPVKVGGYRRWNVDRLARILGVSREDLERRLA